MEVVYFIAHLHSGRIKIGWTVNLAKRLSEISRPFAEPVSLIGSVAGGQKLERAVHKHLKTFRLRAEWFRDCKEVRNAIDDLLCRGPVAIGLSPEAGNVEPPSVTTPCRLAVISRALWPRKTAENLAAVLGKSPRAASYFLAGRYQLDGPDATRLLAYILGI